MKKTRVRTNKTHTALKAVLFTLLGLFAAGAVGCCVFAGVQFAKAPDISEIDASPEGYLTVIEDSSGEKIDSLHVTESNRIYVTLDQTPENLQNAFVSIEDARFWKHHGVDLKGICRAALKGVTTGHFSEGASTITQQLLKNNVFTGWMEESTLMDKVSRKLQEQYLAVQLEKNYSKEWILESYMNTINLGGGTRGVQVASQYYFGKDVSELDLAQCALLAGITKNPSAYNPLTNPDKSIERQQLVLDAMEEEGYITAEEHSAAEAEDVISTLVTHTDSAQIFDWFEDAMLNEIVSDLEEVYGLTEEEAWDKLYTGGLTICSTENTELQRICEEAAQSDDYRQAEEEVSIVVTNVSDGSVAAIVGGREEKTASLVYDRAVSAVRQPGSTLKLLGEYAAQLDRGQITLGTVLDDAPITYSDGTALNNASDSFSGRMTVDQAIAESCNTIALQCYRNAGEGTVMSYLNGFGLTYLDDSDRNEALAIGGTYNGVTNLQLTAAYNAIADGGTYVEPYFYTKVLDHDGNVILENDGTGTRVIQESTADLLTLAMEDVMTEGTGTTAQIDSAEVAGKSGTTNDNRDVWFVGFSSRYTCGVWGGYDDNTAQDSGKYTKKLWAAVMEQACADGTCTELVNTSDYAACSICTKCGKLAVSGLCDDTPQGDMTKTVYYISGTQPAETCDCHVRLTVCSESGKIAGWWCPSEDKETSVWLTSGTAGTDDAAYSAEDILGTTCEVHTSVLDKLFGDDEDGQEPDTDQNNGPDTRPDDGYGHSDHDSGWGSDDGDSFWDTIGGWFGF